MASNDPRVMAVEVIDELITAYLADGRTISVPLVGRGSCPMPPRRNASNSKLSAPGKEYTGQTSMRTSLPSACSLVLLLLRPSKRRG